MWSVEFQFQEPNLKPISTAVHGPSLKKLISEISRLQDLKIRGTFIPLEIFQQPLELRSSNFVGECVSSKPTNGPKFCTTRVNILATGKVQSFPFTTMLTDPAKCRAHFWTWNLRVYVSCGAMSGNFAESLLDECWTDSVRV
jgi:hypothetical protein